MTPELILRNGTVVSADSTSQIDLRTCKGKIAEIDTRIEVQSGQIEIDCAGYYIYPGLINSHDHLEFNLYPRLGEPPYKNAYDWGKDLHKRCGSTIERIESIPLRYRLLWGAWKNLFSGVTRVVHHNRYYARFHFAFPVEVLRRYTFAHSLEFDRDVQQSLRLRKPGFPFIIHLAEGTDAKSSEEINTLKELGGIDQRTVAVHAIAVAEMDIDILREQRASVVWCPSSNLYLFGKTAPINRMIGTIPIAIGTDSTLTGSETLFDELRTAEKETSLTPKQLFCLVTKAPQRVFLFPEDAGDILIGGKADLFLLPIDGADPFQHLLTASPADIALLLKNGSILFCDPNLISSERSAFDGYPLCLNGKTKIIRDKAFVHIFPKLHSYLSHYSYLKTDPRRIN